MDKKLLKEILAAHADQLVKGKTKSKDYLDLLPPESDDELGPLLNVAERVESTLKPISPANKFERDLKRELLNTAQRRQLEGYTPPNPGRDLFILMVTTTFIISLAIVLIAMKRRGINLRR